MLLRYPHLAVLATFSLPLSAAAQHQISAVGINFSTGLMMAHLQGTEAQASGFRLSSMKGADSFGTRAWHGSLYARLENPDSWWVAQSSVGYTYGLSSYVEVGSSYGNGGYGSSEEFVRRVSRGELALLGGARLNEGTYLLLGPVLAANMAGRKPQANMAAENQPILDALASTTKPLQVLARAGFYTSWGRIEGHFSYELGLTPYTRDLRYQGQTYHLGVNNHALLLGLGYDLYKRN